MPSRDESPLALKLGLQQKEKALAELVETLAHAEDQYKSDWVHLDNTLKQIKEGEESVVPRKGLLSRVFSGAASEATKQTLLSKNAEREELLSRLKRIEGIDTQRRILVEQIERYRLKIASIEQSYLAAEERRQREHKREARTNQRLSAVKAKAAALDEASRELASQVKKKLTVQTHCPYCGSKLGVEMHADHIYPLSKGGLSVSSNMVFVCIACNMKKRDMTLNAFIKRFNMVRADVEKRLDQLGKEY